MENKYRQYNITVDTYSTSSKIIREQLCNGFTATNIGDTNVEINGKILFPSATPLTDQGDSVSFGGNYGEIYIGNIEIAFTLPLGTAPLVEIIQKFYTGKEC